MSSLKIQWRGGIAYLHGTIRGKRIRVSLGTRDRQIAEALRAQEEAKLWRIATYGADSEATFADAALQYLRAQAGGNVFLARLLPKLGLKKLAEIKPAQLRLLAKELYPACKPQTWNRQVLGPAAAVINFGHDLGLCPPIRVKRFASHDERIKRAVDRAWIDRFRAAAGPHMAAMALFLFTTAARTGEALALRPQELELEARRGVSRTATKNGARRQFWLTEEMAEELRRLPPRRLRSGRDAGELRVFGWGDKSGFARAWRAACLAAGLDYVTPHEAGRHSFATEAITRQNRSAVMVAKVGNWKGTATLMKNYAHAENMAAFAESVYGGKIGTVLTQ